MEEFSTKVQVNELYSPSWVSQEAQNWGLKVGESHDLVIGWDLDKAANHSRMWQSLKFFLARVETPCVQKNAQVILCYL